VKKQVERAKAGDAGAIKFVFDQVLGGPLKGAQFVQNNFHGDTVVHKDGAKLPEPSVEDRAAIYLQAAGTASPIAIAQSIGLQNTAAIFPILERSRFRKEKNGNYSLAGVGG